jgi:lipopolysaccharide transport system ATP-binding protein
MKRREIVSKLDEIIDFSGVERFLDTPLKHYSSGMQLRLAFSVAAFLEPEILIIDEVLAVGDAEFQRKCLNQMGKVTRSGRTILFVSHNLGAVRSLCNKAVLLDSGKVMMQGHTSEVVERYLTSSTPHKNRDSKKNLSSCGRIEMGLPSWLNSSGESVSRYQYGDNPCLQFELQFKENVQGIVFGIGVNTHDGVRIFTSHSIDDINFTQSEFPKGSCYIRTKLDLPSLAPGSYNIVYGISDKAGAVLLYSENEIQLEIESTQNVKDGANGLLWHTGSWALADKP